MRLELELPREQVLVLDFQTWHCVLNRWHLSLTERESADWESRVEFSAQWAGLPAELEEELQKTWERVFDLEALRRAKFWGPIDKIQGVTERVLLKQVRRVDEFVAV